VIADVRTEADPVTALGSTPPVRSSPLRGGGEPQTRALALEASLAEGKLEDALILWQDLRAGGACGGGLTEAAAKLFESVSVSAPHLLAGSTERKLLDHLVFDHPGGSTESPPTLVDRHIVHVLTRCDLAAEVGARLDRYVAACEPSLSISVPSAVAILYFGASLGSRHREDLVLQFTPRLTHPQWLCVFSTWSGSANTTCLWKRWVEILGADPSQLTFWQRALSLLVVVSAWDRRRFTSLAAKLAERARELPEPHRELKGTMDAVLGVIGLRDLRDDAAYAGAYAWPERARPLATLSPSRRIAEALPSGWHRKRALRIAICVSGQLRGCASALDSWRAHLGIDRHHTTTFLHTWKDAGWRFPHPVLPFADRSFPPNFSRAYCELGARIGLDILEQRYPTLVGYFRKGGERLSASYLREMFRTDFVTIEDEAVPPIDGFGNPAKMYYGVSACYRMARESGLHFDLVLRLRPDAKLRGVGSGVDWFQVARKSRRRKVIFCEPVPPLSMARHVKPSGQFVMGDQMAAGADEWMSVYASAWEFTEVARRNELYGFPRFHRPHDNFAYVTLVHGINVQPLEGLKIQTLLNPTILSPVQILELLRPDLGQHSRKDEVRLLDALRRDAARLPPEVSD
jgi:hypothetical protein